MVWLIGCKGMLGSEIARQLDDNSIPWVGTDTDVDITDPLALEAFASSHDSTATKTGGAVSKGKTHGKIKWVINCAAFTDVNRAESSEELATKLIILYEPFALRLPSKRVSNSLISSIFHIATPVFSFLYP